MRNHNFSREVSIAKRACPNALFREVARLGGRL